MDRPPFSSLLEKLNKLRIFLNQPDKKMNVIEAYNAFKQGNKDNCVYAKKCEKIFKRELYAETKQLISEIKLIIDKIEG